MGKKNKPEQAAVSLLDDDNDDVAVTPSQVPREDDTLRQLVAMLGPEQGRIAYEAVVGNAKERERADVLAMLKEGKVVNEVLSAFPSFGSWTINDLAPKGGKTRKAKKEGDGTRKPRMSKEDKAALYEQLRTQILDKMQAGIDYKMSQILPEGVEAGHVRQVLAGLIEAGFVVRQGEKLGTTYRVPA